MTDFAHDLSARLTSHDSFWESYLALQSMGAAATLQCQIDSQYLNLKKDELIKLLYCASVFVQSNDDEYKMMAQAIALSALLVSEDKDVSERCGYVLTELGNFPGLIYSEKNHGLKNLTLLGQLRRRLTEELNTVNVGVERLPLTDYQKNVWEELPVSQAIAISAPTSAGKSFLVIEHMCRTAMSKERYSAVYVAPTRALLAEVYQKVQARLSGHKSVRISGVPSLDSENNTRQIYILTQERLQVLLSVSEMKFDLLVIDEAQNISDGARGMIMQECLEQVVHRNSNVQVIMLAPGAEGFDGVARLVGVPHLKTTTTTVSPVLQNRILVNKVPGLNKLKLSLLTQRGEISLGYLTSDRGFELPASRLASVALELGSVGGSLVYATGPSDAERVSMQLVQDRSGVAESEELNELSIFIKKHIHPEYKLAAIVKRGVAFHYGKMPNLLRESIEKAFSNGALQYLVCTTTLFQGINLPARNVFIDTPTRGQGSVLDPALLWNFAGRAGRMKKDIVGNVFLVDYDEWAERPMDNFVRFVVVPSTKKTIIESYKNVLDALGGKMPPLNPRDDSPTRIRACAGLLIAKASRDDVEDFARRFEKELGAERVKELVNSALNAVEDIQLPASILSANWVIDPYGLKRLHLKIKEKINKGEIQDLIPINPHENGSSSLYGGIFTRILRAVYKQQGNFGGYVSSLAIPWMKGQPYPSILSKAIKKERERANKKLLEYEEKKRENPATRARPPKQVDSSEVIRKVFDTIEDVVRFQFVQLGKAYIDILAYTLDSEGHGDLVPTIFDFSLALELGISTKSGRSFVELGLSRITASVLEQLYPDTNLSVQQARDWLRDIDVHSLGLSQVLVDEIQGLGLVPS